MSVPGPGARAAPPSGRILHPSHIASRGLKGSALRRRPWTKAGHIPTSPAVLPASGSPCKPQPPSSHASARSFNNSARSMRTLPWRGTSVLYVTPFLTWHAISLAHCAPCPSPAPSLDLPQAG